MKIAFDIGGVLGRYPKVFHPLIKALKGGNAEVYVITDVPERDVAHSILNRYGYDIPPERILCSDYRQHGERCKAVLIKEYGIDILVHDHPGYCADSGCVSLFVWPDPGTPFEASDYQQKAMRRDSSRPPSLSSRRNIWPMWQRASCPLDHFPERFDGRIACPRATFKNPAATPLVERFLEKLLGHRHGIDEPERQYDSNPESLPVGDAQFRIFKPAARNYSARMNDQPEPLQPGHSTDNATCWTCTWADYAYVKTLRRRDSLFYQETVNV